MDTFHDAFKNFQRKTRSASYAGGVELSRVNLAPYSEYWDKILDKLASHRGGHPQLEKALSLIGEPLVPLLKKQLAKSTGEPVAALLRIFSYIVGPNGREEYLAHAQNCKTVCHTALMLLARFYPHDAVSLVYAAAESESSGDLFNALLMLKTREAFGRAQLMARSAAIAKGFVDQTHKLADCLPLEVKESVFIFATEQLNDGVSTSETWPFEEAVLASSARSEIDEGILVCYFKALLKYHVAWVRRNAAIELAARDEPTGLEALRSLALYDRFAAKAAMEACSRQDVRSFFDWFAEGLAIIPDPSLLSADAPYGYVINRLSVAVAADDRWKRWLDLHTGPQYAYLKALRNAIQSPVELLDSNGPERLKALETLADQKSPLVLEWIEKRLAVGDTLQREEYFSILESLRKLGDPAGLSAARLAISKFKPTAFAKDFADEVERALAASK
jgi:hypothetical protein